jgi:hypothetical protein
MIKDLMINLEMSYSFQAASSISEKVYFEELDQLAEEAFDNRYFNTAKA